MSKKQVTEHNKYFATALSRGANVQSFECFECGFVVQNLAPETEGAVWGSMCFCPACDKAYFKTVISTDIEVVAL